MLQAKQQVKMALPHPGFLIWACKCRAFERLMCRAMKLKAKAKLEDNKSPT